MKDKRQSGISRRNFVKASLMGVVASTVDVRGFPAIVRASVLGANAPGKRINVGAIGTGRISRGHDLPGIWRYDDARIVAVCDLDSKRLEQAKTLVNDYYTKKSGAKYDGVSTYSDYRSLLQNKDIDAVVISTPDHWHAIIAIE